MIYLVHIFQLFNNDLMQETRCKILKGGFNQPNFILISLEHYPYSGNSPLYCRTYAWSIARFTLIPTRRIEISQASLPDLLGNDLICCIHCTFCSTLPPTDPPPPLLSASLSSWWLHNWSRDVVKRGHYGYITSPKILRSSVLSESSPPIPKYEPTSKSTIPCWKLNNITSWNPPKAENIIPLSPLWSLLKGWGTRAPEKNPSIGEEMLSLLPLPLVFLTMIFLNLMIVLQGPSCPPLPLTLTTSYPNLKIGLQGSLAPPLPFVQNLCLLSPLWLQESTSFTLQLITQITSTEFVLLPIRPFTNIKYG